MTQMDTDSVAPSHRSIAVCPQMTQMDADFIADIADIAMNTKIGHHKGHKGIAFESGRRVAGRVFDFVVTRYQPDRD